MKKDPRVMVSLRLEPEKHRRLRIICAKQNKRAQHIIEKLVDEFLEKEERKGEQNANQ